MRLFVLQKLHVTWAVKSQAARALFPKRAASAGEAGPRPTRLLCPPRKENGPLLRLEQGTAWRTCS